MPDNFLRFAWQATTADMKILKNDDSENSADSDFDENEEFVYDDFLEM